MTFNNFLAAVLLYLGTVPVALACAFHATPEVHLEGMYPGSLTVAVALRNAADNGVIDADALEAPGQDNALYDDTVKSLQAFRNTLADSPIAAELPASFSLGYVESNLWTRYTQSNSKITVDIHTNGPAKGEAVLITGEPVLKELLAGRLSVDQAMADGMILIIGSDSEKQAILTALITTSMSGKVSSR